MKLKPSPEQTPKFKIVDLFAGCGGLSRGFEWTGRFGSQMAVELEKHPAETFAANIKTVDGKTPHVYQGDIEALTKNPRHLWNELRAAEIFRPGEIDVLVGGPPCQGFSRNGVRQYLDDDRSVRFYDDPRNHLYKAFLKVVEETKPKLLLIENVREFLNFGEGKFSQQLVSKLGELNYDVCYKSVCAADYGVPQLRHRVFFMAIQKQLADRAGLAPGFPATSFGARSDNNTTRLALTAKPSYRTVRDAIGDLPLPAMNHIQSPQSYGAKKKLSELAVILRRDSEVLYNHVGRTLSEKNLQRIRAVGTGRMKHIESDLQTRAFYGSAYRRMAWDEPSLTITTWVYHVGSGPYAHPEQDRAITMREAARVQTFDDKFIFPALINPVSQMIGNAVPPLLANVFAEEYLRSLDMIYSKVKIGKKTRLAEQQMPFSFA